MGQWKKLGSEYLLKTRWLSVRKDTYDSPLGKEMDFYVVERQDFATCVPITPDGRYLMVRQYRHGTEKVELNFPKGKLELGEDSRQCVERELKEETGYKSSSIEYLGAYHLSQALTNMKSHLFVARDIEAIVGHEAHADEEVDSLVFMTAKEIEEGISSGTITDAISVLAYLLIK